MIIGISGKIGSGKSTAANMLRYLSAYGQLTEDKSYEAFKIYHDAYQERTEFFEDASLLCSAQFGTNVKIKKFATKLKQIVSLLTGIPVEDLEKEEVKARILGEEWTRYGTAKGFFHHYVDGERTDIIMNNVQCSKEEYEAHLKINWQTAYKQEFTPRLLFQYIGTDLFREKINTDIWVNALLADYKSRSQTTISKDCPRQGVYEVTEQDELQYGSIDTIYPTWIISDVRFPNEAQAIKDRGGIVIRLERKIIHQGLKAAFKFINDRPDVHPSETALDNYEFNYIIDNNGTLEQLYEKLKALNLFANV